RRVTQPSNWKVVLRSLLAIGCSRRRSAESGQQGPEGVEGCLGAGRLDAALGEQHCRPPASGVGVPDGAQAAGPSETTVGPHLHLVAPTAARPEEAVRSGALVVGQLVGPHL